MKKNEVKESSNVVVINSADEKLTLEVGKSYEFDGKILTISAKRTHTEENPTTGKKTLWSGTADGVDFAEVDACKVRKLFGLAERKREKSAGKTFEFEGHTYSLDETADAMINAACAKYSELLTLLQNFEKQYGIYNEPVDVSDFVEECRELIAKKVESVCLARKVAFEKEAERLAAEKEAKAKASKEHRDKVKEAKSEFFSLLAAGISFADVSEKIAEKFGLQISDLA